MHTKYRPLASGPNTTKGNILPLCVSPIVSFNLKIDKFGAHDELLQVPRLIYDNKQQTQVENNRMGEFSRIVHTSNGASGR